MQKKPYLKKLQWGPPGNLELMEELLRGYSVDGSTVFVPGDDYGENEGQDAWAEEEEEFQATPSPMGRSSSTQRSKRSFASTSTT